MVQQHQPPEGSAGPGAWGPPSAQGPSGQPTGQWGRPPAWTPAPPRRGPAPGVEYAGFWIRVVAFVLDAIILGVVTGALSPLLGQSTVVSMADGFHVEYNYVGGALSTLLGLVYYIGAWAYFGQTPGMIPFRMRVVRSIDGGPVDVVRGLLRYVGLIISFVVIFLGVIWVGFDWRKQGWHDKLADTVVIRLVA
jgi:uncharacterized RDD family membrane protein YckC